MTIFFASPGHLPGSPVANGLIAGVPLSAANDNAAGDWPRGEILLHKALRHFAEHGLSAARVAGDNARMALAGGDGAECRYWLAICRTLDRRLAAVTARRLGLQA
ncbi:MAG: hypothetical protein RIQ46_1549 [Pseudomonadota bacterium]|jgi:hypothetical protein